MQIYLNLQTYFNLNLSHQATIKGVFSVFFTLKNLLHYKVKNYMSKHIINIIMFIASFVIGIFLSIPEDCERI